MTAPQQPIFGHTASSFKETAKAVRLINRTNPRLPRVKRRVFPTSSFSLYVVTQQSVSANVAVVREVTGTLEANPSYTTFKAQPFDETTPVVLSLIDHSKDEDVSTIALTGALFTGQSFLCMKGDQKVAQGGDGLRFRAVVKTVASPNCQVTITYLAWTASSLGGPLAPNNTVDLYAANETGATLVVGQNVIVELMNHVNSTNTRWRIAEYTCP